MFSCLLRLTRLAPVVERRWATVVATSSSSAFPLAQFLTTKNPTVLAAMESDAGRKKLPAQDAAAVFEEEVKFGVRQLKACSTKHFNESIDVALNLLIEKNKLHEVRGVVQLPFGTGAFAVCCDRR